MIDRISLRLFLACLILCAALVLGIIWTQGTTKPPLYFEVTATLFIVGLTSFLLWFTNTLRRIANELKAR